MSDELFETMKRFVGFGPADHDRLRRLGDMIRPHFVPIVDEFYARIDRDPEARAVVERASDKSRLKATLVSWLGECFEGPWEGAYFVRRSRIGHRHVEIGLPQHYMLTAMNVIRQQVCDLIVRGDGEVDLRRQQLTSVDRLFDLELAIMLHTYREEHSERLYRSVVDGVDAIIVGVDEQGIVRMWNRAAEAATGRSAVVVIGKPMASFLSTEAGVGALGDALDAARSGKAMGAVELTLETASGQQRFVRWAFGPLESNEGLGALVVAIGEDMTDRMELERRAAEAEAMASLGTLTAGLAHEIRNPLNAASLQLELLRRGVGKLGGGEASENAIRRVGIVEEELSRLTNLLDDFLNLAKPRGFVRDSVDLTALLPEVIELQQPVAEAAGVRLEATCGAEPVLARGDHDLLKQVFVNLVLNAIDALTGQPDGCVTLGCRSIGIERVEATVEDNGPGIPPEVQGRLFSPFVTSKEAGTGLGLTIVKRVVDRHGGTIHLASRSTGGTIARIHLPRFT